MDLSFYPLNVEVLDQASAEAVCLFLASDERPLTGLAGLIDWRLTGRLSRLLRGGVLQGTEGEAVLTPSGTKVPFRKMFLFGLGPQQQTPAELEAHLREALHKLAQAGVQEVALELPARLPAEVGVKLLLEELHDAQRAMVFGPDTQKLVAALSQAARGTAQVERRVVKVEAPKLPTPPRAQPVPAAPVVVPRASPLPFAPSSDAPATEFTPPPPAPIPAASPLPFAPETGSVPVAPAVHSEPPAKSEPPRYKPEPPKQNVFEKKKRK